MRKIIKIQLRILLVGIVILIALMLFASCKPKNIPIESVKTEYRDKYIRDSIFQKELVRIYQKGDTVFRDRFISVYKDRFKTDSINIRDTIRVPYPVKGDTIIKEVNRLNWYQEACIWFTSLVLVALALYLGIKYRGKILAFFRKLIFKI